jgi:nucleotide-binding universal stress UspA family protein
MLRKPVVVGVDGSSESRHAATVAHALARAARARCHLVYAFPDLAPPTPLGPAVLAPDIAARLMAEAHRDVAATLRGELPDGLVDGLEMRTGPAAWVLTETARRLGAGVVVVGGRHHGALGRALGGSTTHRLARTCEVPVLVVRPGPPGGARVLAAVDLSDAASATLSAAASYARLLGGELRVVHVVEPVRIPRVVPLALDEADVHRRSVEALEARLRAARLRTCDRVVRRGTAVEAIASEVVDWGATLLVVGSHGKGFVDRLLIGSTTERLLNLLPTSLLVVPAVADRARAPARRTARRSRRRHAVTRRVS